MAASEKHLIYREDAEPAWNGRATADYVDLNDFMERKANELRTVKVTFTGEGSQLGVYKSNGGTGEHKATVETGDNRGSDREEATEQTGDSAGSFETASSEGADTHERVVERVETPVKNAADLREQSPLEDGLQDADTELGRKSDSDEDDATIVPSDETEPEAGGAQPESHYITTHEIQLSELDHDTDFDLASGSSWDIEDDHRVYSFVDYASFDSDQTISEDGAAVSAHPESDLCVPEPRANSDQSVGQIHLSIKATSRAINEPSSPRGKESMLYHAKRPAVAADDNVKRYIALPGRLHFGGKIRGKDAHGWSSGASSAVSELDEADKEVRNLTARAFKSLAYPYFDTINFSTSSESSASEHGLGMNRWSTFVDLKYNNVNVTKGREPSVTYHKYTSNFHLAKNKGGTGLTMTSLRAPPVEIFALNGNLVDPKNATKSAAKQIELMGKLGKGEDGLIRLSETLNFRCNVGKGARGDARLADFAQNAAGSRSTDEVTNTLPGGQGSEASKQPCNAGESMDGTHKKAIFASSLLKNVISKKMQFEQERKMERGEISEPYPASSPCFHEGARERGRLQRQGSKLSEADSDLTIGCLDDLGDVADANSCDARGETNLEATNEAGIDTKKGSEAFEASKSALLRSQNSAFRCWRDGELEFQKEQHKNDKPPEVRLSLSSNSKFTKMSHLFVPSIQILSSEKDAGKNAPAGASFRGEVITGLKLRADDQNRLYVADRAGSVVTSKSPEIKISLRSVKDGKRDPFGIARLLAPGAARPSEDSKCHALAEKVPHFMVRDIRDNKNKLQTPIHQVRDVRKLVKSSYHFVSLDNQESRCSVHAGDVHSEGKSCKQGPQQRNAASLSPIVIKCHSVNTNSGVKQSGNPIEVPKRRAGEETLEAAEGANRRARANVKRAKGDLPEGPVGARIEAKTAARRPERGSESVEKKPESKMANQAALEKLQAAVKTMEQLYIFDKNEWKRKTEPRPLIDSHVLSLISREEHEGPDEETGNDSAGTVRGDLYPGADKTSPVMVTSATDKPFHTPVTCEDRNVPKALIQASGGTKVPLSTSTRSSVKTSQLSSASQMPFSSKSFSPKSAKLPSSLKFSPSRHVAEDREKPNGSETTAQQSGLADSENYLTIPVKSHANPSRQEKMSLYRYTAGVSKGKSSSPPSHPGHIRCHIEGRQSIGMETRSPDTPTATIYHHALPVAISSAQPQVICFSPTVAQPPPSVEHFQPTQRKMLLDPTTGNYYLVDTPVQPATRRLFDPETGQYVDVPMPQPPMTPLPMSVSPLALSSNAYSHTVPYMIYPGFMPTPTVIPSRLQSQISVQSEADERDKVHLGQQGDGAYMEGPYYMPTGKTMQAAPMTHHSSGPGGRAGGSNQPVISITSQQGPRIIAPPSFDGTTMSFVVEHR
ncbi:uncharacterized protein C4orf54 homolog [Denticeps clupeoides]|uniref:DUF4585 domain-containing protein n=1 Tax=Denticeps clupeoides TaxID=299321 RepID=A0AAY4DXG9_9TELE|nr:uncharacterized protein C4orf54 homolog [Denticeps clupeoides]